MFLPAALLTLALVPSQQQTPAHHRAASKSHSAAPDKAKKDEAAAPKGPKSEAEFQQDLTAALREADFHGDSITLSLSGKDITLRGDVHSAEHKGLATRTARKIAEKDGWKDVHVLNQLSVQLPR